MAIRTILICLFTLFLGNSQADLPGSAASIEIWYGAEQHFGIKGNPQRQVNILGRVLTDLDGVQLYFTLNGAAEKRFLTLGSDMHRLAEEGDFNIEISRQELSEGKNVIEVFAVRQQKMLARQLVTLNYTYGNKWPLPYRVNWKEVKKIQDVVEIVDGQWELTDRGIRTRNRYYDRLLVFGDTTWRNYEVRSSVVFHDFTAPEEGPPTYNVTHVAIASRWPGHDKDSLQPNRKWFPLGATSEFRITEKYENCRWRIFDGSNFYAEQGPENYRKIQAEKLYNLKHRVEDLSDKRTLYSVKLWEADLTEPEEWDFQAVEIRGERESGSACLIAHHTDVTFGDIEVVAVFED